MDDLLAEVERLKASGIRDVIDSRMKEFSSVEDLFSELCFCLMTANFNAERSIRIQKEVGEGFVTLSEDRLAERLRELGHRFPNTRAKYIVEARRHRGSIMLDRDWLVKNVKGLGLKEASHFLRNVGEKDYAIIDFHIVDLLARYKLVHKPKTISKSDYLRFESVLEDIAKRVNLNLAELDLYLWYIETGKVLK